MAGQALLPLVFLAAAAQSSPLPALSPAPACALRATAAIAPAAATSREWITNVRATAALTPQALAGTRLSVRDVRVERVDGAGFWVATGVEHCSIFVVAAEHGLITVRPGDVVDLQGEFRRAAAAPNNDASKGDEAAVYVYAYTVRHAPPADSASPGNVDFR